MNLDAKRANSFLRQLTAVTEAGINKIAHRTGLALVALLVVSASAFAQTAPNLGSLAPFGVVSSTFTNTSAATSITGNVCFSTGPAVTPMTSPGATYGACPVAAGPDQLAALATVNGQLCTSLPVGPLEGISIGGGPPGTFPPGCYFSAGALDISVNGVVNLNGAGVYIFRSSGGALTTGANSRVNLIAGACASDVFWAPTGATTLGANAAPTLTATFVGTILDAAGVTLGLNANLSGRALAFGGTVTTDASVISVPTCAPFVPPVAAPPTIAKTFAPASISTGGVSILTVTLSNANATVATLNAALVDTLPAQVFIAATPNASTTCGGAGAPVAAPGGSTLTLPAGRTIPANGSCTLSVNVTSAVVGGFVNTIPIGALVTSNGNNAVAANATLTVTALAAIPIPTLSEWAMILLAGLMAIAGFTALRRQQP